MISFGLRQVVEDPPPFLRVLDVKGKLQSHTGHATTIYSIRMHQNLPFFMKKRRTMAIFLSKVEIFVLSPILRALDAKEQIVGTYRSRKHSLQHPYAPKYAIFL